MLEHVHNRQPTVILSFNVNAWICAQSTTDRDLETKKRMLGYVHLQHPTMILPMPFFIYNCNNCNVCNVCDFDADLLFSIFFNL